MILNKEKNQGITLIALVITIIVLLILAGITIATLTGENGVLAQASKAKLANQIAQEKEELTVAYNGAKTEKRGEKIVDEDMNKQFTQNGTRAKAKGSNIITVKFIESGRTYQIDENGNITDSTVEWNDYVITATMTNLYRYYVGGDTANGYQLKNNGTDCISIENKEELKYLSDYTNQKHQTENVTFVLIDNINLNEGITFGRDGSITGGTPEEWVPMGKMQEVQIESQSEWENKKAEYGKLYTADDVSMAYSSRDQYFYAESLFKGKIDGQNYTISGMYLQGTGIGLIGGADGAIIQNLSMSNNYLLAKDSSGIVIARAIQNGITLKNLAIQDNYVSLKGNNIGGILGVTMEGNTVLDNVTSNSVIVPEQNNNSFAAGGIAGRIMGSSCSIKNCSNYTSIIADNKKSIYIEAIAGIIGFAAVDNLTIDNCSNSGNIEGYWNGQAGILGQLDNSGKVVISNCQNTGEVGGGTFTGGILGFEVAANSTEISNCCNSGKIYNIEKTAGILGGILGDTKNGIIMSNCYNTGEIYASEENYVSSDVGGLIGYAGGKIYNCYNAGKINIYLHAQGAQTIETVGGLIGGLGTGWNSAQVSNCYNIGEIIINYPESVRFIKENYFGEITGMVYDEASVENCYSFANRVINNSHCVIGTNIGSVADNNGIYEGVKKLFGYHKLNDVYPSIGSKGEHITQQNVKEVETYQSQEFCDLLNEWVADNSEYSKWKYDPNKNNGVPYLESLENTIK